MNGNTASLSPPSVSMECRVLNALPARKILLSTLKVWESGAGVKTVTSVRSVMDPLHWRKLGIVRMFGSSVTVMLPRPGIQRQYKMSYLQ